MTPKYEEYINSSAWRAKRKQAFKFHGRRCQGCGRVHFLQAHHLSYERLGAEKMEDLMPLCTPCHEFVHANGIAYSIGNAPRVEVPDIIGTKMAGCGLDPSEHFAWGRKLRMRELASRSAININASVSRKENPTLWRQIRRERRRLRKIEKRIRSREQSERAKAGNAMTAKKKTERLHLIPRFNPNPSSSVPIIDQLVRPAAEDAWASQLDSDFSRPDAKSILP